jgi:hypothetical protein
MNSRQNDTSFYADLARIHTRVGWDSQTWHLNLEDGRLEFPLNYE